MTRKRANAPAGCCPEIGQTRTLSPFAASSRDGSARHTKANGGAVAAPGGSFGLVSAMEQSRGPIERCAGVQRGAVSVQRIMIAQPRRQAIENTLSPLGFCHGWHVAR